MKSNNKYFILLVIALSTYNVNSQTDPINSFRQDFLVLNNSNAIIQNINQLVQNANIIQVNQVGSGNDFNLNITSNNSKLDLNQYGSDNYVDVYKSSNELLQSVDQRGSNNFISDFSLNYEDQVNMSVSQNGNNLSLYNNGSNSISKNMKITQTGNSGRVYIFNH